MHKKNIGTIGELLVVTQCLKNHCSVFKDVGDNSRFDLIVADGNSHLFKVQVKHFKSVNGTIRLKFTSSGPGYSYKYEVKDVDYFALVDQDTGSIAWIKYEDYHHNSDICLRFVPSRTKSSLYFQDFEKFPFHSPIV